MKTEFLKTKKDIINWLDKYEVKNYILIQDPVYGYKINVKDIVYLNNKNLKSIPVKFNEVGGDFYCNKNQLTSLRFCPTNVGGAFYCHENQLTSLEFCPKSVGGSFYCSHNQLTSLEFCPTNVDGAFYCAGNPALGNAQDIINFADISNIHQEIVNAKKEKKELESQLEELEPDKSSVNNRKAEIFKL